MNQIVAFLKNNKISTHTAASALLFLIGGYAAVPPFHSLVNQIALAHPNLDEWATAAIGLFLLYYNGRKSAS